MLSTVWNTQRGSWSSIEKRRKEIEVTKRKGGGVKKRETNLACDQFPKYSPSPKHPKRFTELSRKEKGEGGDRGDLEEKKESKGERAIKPVITLLSKNGY